MTERWLTKSKFIFEDKKDGDLEPQVLEEDGLMNVLRRQKEMNMDECKEDALQDVVLASILQNHSSLVKTCHQNQTLLQHDPEQRLKPEVFMQYIYINMYII